MSRITRLLLLLLGYCATRSNSYRPSLSRLGGEVIDPGCLHFVERLTVETAANAGFEHFSIDGAHYLAVANFWDGVSQGMMAESKVWQILDEDDAGGLRLELVQTFRGAGAHGIEYFEIAATDADPMSFLSIPNYYGKTNVVYKYDRATRKFAHFQTLDIEGPAQCEVFTLDDSTTYLLIGENFKHALALFKFEPTAKKFVLVQKVKTPGAGAMAVVSNGGGEGSSTFTDFPYIVSTSYHDGGWDTRTPIFKWNGNAATHKMEAHQTVTTTGPHDAGKM